MSATTIRPGTGSAQAPARPRTIVLAYNPEAGGFSAAGLAALRDALAGAGHRVTTQDSLSFRIPAASGEVDLASQVDLVCIVGGDGTARTVIGLNRQAAGNAAYCVYPAGTVNLIAREAGYSAGADALLRRLNGDAPSRRHFLGEINGQAFLCCASAGVDSLVVARASPVLKRRLGKLAYLVALLGLVWRWPRHRITVTVDGAAHVAEAVYVMKGRYYAGPWVLDDEAALGADHFRVLLLDRARRRDMVRLFLSAAISRRLASPRWLRLTARSIALAAPAGLPLQADGDIVATVPARIDIVDEPLTFA